LIAVGRAIREHRVMMKRAEIDALRWPRLAAVLVGASVILLTVVGCSGASESDQGEYHVIPSSSSRPTDPSIANESGHLSAEEVPLGQLWGLANSEVGDEETSSAGVGLADFSAAITSRCYPLLTEADATELDRLKAAYELFSGAEAAQSAHAYFTKATELCM
jgi:hypothetical protein